MNLDFASIGRRIKHARQAADMTQAQLGEQCELSQSEISRIEQGQRDLSVTNLMALASAVGVEPARLLYGDDKAAA